LSPPFAITKPNEFVAEVHDRTVLLSKKDFDPRLSSEMGLELLKPAAKVFLQRWPVSKTKYNQARAARRKEHSMSRNKIMTATAVAVLFTGLAVTDGFARGGGGGGHGGGFGGGGFAGSGTAHIGGSLGGGNLGGGLGATRPRGGFNGSGMARGPGGIFSGPGDSSRYRTARGEPDHYGLRFHDRDHDHFRHRFLFAPYEDYGYACDYSYPWTYRRGCVVSNMKVLRYPAVAEENTDHRSRGHRLLRESEILQRRLAEFIQRHFGRTSNRRRVLSLIVISSESD
jgi:hypothetical protein